MYILLTPRSWFSIVSPPLLSFLKVAIHTPALSAENVAHSLSLRAIALLRSSVFMTDHKWQPFWCHTWRTPLHYPLVESLATRLLEKRCFCTSKEYRLSVLYHGLPQQIGMCGPLSILSTKLFFLTLRFCSWAGVQGLKPVQQAWLLPRFSCRSTWCLSVAVLL